MSVESGHYEQAIAWIGVMRQHESSVLIKERAYTVTVYKRDDEPLWTATGNYEGHGLRVQGHSPGSALINWCETARNAAGLR